MQLVKLVVLSITKAFFKANVDFPFRISESLFAVVFSIVLSALKVYSKDSKRQTIGTKITKLKAIMDIDTIA
jgi:hypothetical protein